MRARRRLGSARSTPTTCVFRGGQFYLIGYSHERDAVRVFRLSRIRGKVSYATKAEHDFTAARGLRPPRLRAAAPTGSSARPRARAKIFLRERIAWLVERDFGRYGELRKPARKADGATGRGTIFETEYASSRQLVAWVLRWRENAAVLDPPELADEADERLALLRDRHRERLRAAEDGRPPARRGRDGAATALALQRPRASRRSAPSASPAWSRSPGC